jgi:lanosterol synthase
VSVASGDPHAIVPSAEAARDRALAHLLACQSPRGDWEGEMVWCPMITAQSVIVRRVVGRDVDARTRDGILRHFQATRTPDGAWGLHPESAGYVFVTTLVYVALRLLGVGPDEPPAKEARTWLERQPGGVTAIPTWGKFWLALIGLYGWAGVRPCPPELTLLPRWLPFHPMRYYCHTRHIYLAMAYLSGRRFTADLGPLRDDLARELYGGSASSIGFAAYRERIAATDLHVRPGAMVRLAGRVLAAWERVHPRALRARALARCLAHVVYEQRVSAYQALSPVSGLLSCLALFADDPHHPDLAPSLAGLEAWRWDDAAGGVRYAGARSSTWDTAFAMEALAASDAAGAAPAVRRGYAFLGDAQVTTELSAGRDHGRDAIAGGWCFSDGTHRWPVSDCAAEAVSALLAVEARPALAPAVDERIARDRLRSAVHFMLARQNGDGGFGTYERRRGPRWLERMNPSEMFGRCMTDGSYVECTASVLVALARLRDAKVAVAGPAVERAVARAVTFLRGCQRDDGSVPGAWGINFTYGAFHFVRGLAAAGASLADPQLQRAAAWLVAHQREDGGWGEHWSGCLSDTYVEHAESQTVMTSWALLALLEVLDRDAEAIRRGIAWLLRRQDPAGGFPAGAVNGVFFGSAMLDYRLYPVHFPAWALARYCS